MRSNLALLLTTVTAALACGARSTAAADPQYSAEGITIPAATVDEPIRKQFSLEAAQNYLEQGALAWKRSAIVLPATQQGPTYNCVPASPLFSEHHRRNSATF